MDITDKIKKYLKEGMYDIANNYATPEDAFKEGNLFIYMNKVLNANIGKLKVGDWEADEEPHMGTWAWSKVDYKTGDDRVVYITPFFDNDTTIDWEASEEPSGKHLGSSTVKFKVTGNPSKDLRAYLTVAKKILTSLK